MKVADLSRQMREIEAGLQHADARLAGARWRRGRRRSRKDQPKWTVLASWNTSATTTSNSIPQTDGSYLAQGYAPTKFTEVVQRQDEPQAHHRVSAGTADRPEPAGRRAGAVDQGDLRDDRVLGRSRTGVDAGQEDEGEIRRRDVGLRSAGARPGADLLRQDRTTTASPARCSSRSTATTKPAWGIDAGPGRRNQDRKAVFNCEKPIDVDGDGRDPHLPPRSRTTAGGTATTTRTTTSAASASPSPTTGGKVVADPLPRARARDPGRSRRQHARRQQIAEVFSYWRTTVPEWKEANDKIEALWKQWPAGRDVADADRPRRAARDAHADPRRLAQADDAGARRACRVSQPAAAGRPADAADARPLAGRSQVADDRPRVRQPHLAGLLRHRPRRDAGRFRHAGRMAEPPGTARLARLRIHGAA